MLKGRAVAGQYKIFIQTQSNLSWNIIRPSPYYPYILNKYTQHIQGSVMSFLLWHNHPIDLKLACFDTLKAHTNLVRKKALVL